MVEENTEFTCEEFDTDAPFGKTVVLHFHTEGDLSSWCIGCGKRTGWCELCYRDKRMCECWTIVIDLPGITIPSARLEDGFEAQGPPGQGLIQHNSF